MFRNYVTIALRNLVKHRLYSMINIVGLAVGLAAAVLILLLVRNETSYDSFFATGDRTYQVTVELRVPGREPQRVAASSWNWGPAYKEDHPDVQDVVRMTGGRAVARTGADRFYQEYSLVDANFLEVFDFPLVAGDRASALSDPSALVLTETMARKFFGGTDVVGRTLTLDGKVEVRVTAVMMDPPPNTHFDLTLLLPVTSPLLPSYLREGDDSWGNTCCATYVRFKEGADVARAQAEVADWMKRRAPPIQTPQGPIPIGEILVPSFRQLTAIHTDPITADATAGISMVEIYTLFAIAVLVLVVASINFMNLATARATQRAREVGVRKVVGATRTQIVVQFIGESILITAIGMLLALALAEVTIPAYGAFLGKDLQIDYADPHLIGMLVGLALVVGIAGGSYPAFYLSAFNPARVMKGETGGGGSGRLRTTLVVIQFAISIGLMIATAVVYGQFLYARTKALGFDKDNVVVVGYWTTPGVREHRDAFIETLRKDSSIVDLGLGGFLPGDPWESNTLIRRPDDPSGRELVVRNDAVGFDYFRTLGMKILAGRDFERDRGTDVLVRPDWQLRNEPPPQGVTELVVNASAVVNRTAALRLGFTTPEEAIGAVFTTADSPVTTVRATIIGVVEDFHFRSIHEPILPSIYLNDPGNLHAMAIRVKGGQMRQALDLIDRTWAQLIQDRPLERPFLDDAIRRMYERERKTGQVFAVFSGLAILIACLGLFGLASFTAERRTREIGLRKVLGARVPDIVRLLVWQFSKPVLIANLIAWPVAWFVMGQWLEGFAYRIAMDPLVFVASGIAALVIAWVTVGMHAYRIAQSRPVAALRRD